MNNKIISATLCALIFSLPFCKGQDIKRIFREGNKKKYQLVLEEWHNGKQDIWTRAVCELNTINDSGSYYELVKWISMVQAKGKDSIVGDTIAAKVKPYRIALDSSGKLEIPKIDVPAMTQPIQDFTTFFVAISTQLGIAHLKHVGDVYEIPSTIKGDLASGNFILEGEDCFRVKLKYQSKKRKEVTIVTSFEPPKDSCLTYLLPEMNIPVSETVRNNIQMIMPSNDKFNIQYGLEEFTIESHISRRTGTLLHATMSNSIILKMKINCNANYQDCSFEMPFRIVRKLKLEKFH